MKNRKFSRPRRRIIKPGKCFYCEQKLNPDYKDLENLKKFVTERGKILPKMHSGICNRHQRHLAMAIRRARFLALLPFLVTPF